MELGRSTVYTQGRRSEGFKKKPRGNVSILLRGGPKDGEVLTYSQPLPPVLVVCDKQTMLYHDYRRSGDGKTGGFIYEHCERKALGDNEND